MAGIQPLRGTNAVSQQKGSAMKSNPLVCSSTLLLGLLLAAGAGVSARAAGLVGGAAGAASGAINPPELPRMPSPTPSVSGAATVGADATAAAAAGRATTQADGSASATVGADAGNRRMGDAKLSVAPLAAMGASASLNGGETTHAINALTLEGRDALFPDLKTRLDASATAMDSLRKSSQQLDAEGRAHFEAADKDVKAKEQMVRSSLRAAQTATASNWTETRGALANDYAVYATAVANAEAAANAGTKASGR
jgi:hypothetical protein